ncbi:SRPBCC family protein [Kiritimatiellota bacterium B12222]|nr:SRPBCC family protein [Kiritimatiellota bacterium B12222]
MPQTHIQKMITIEAPLAEVFAQVSDLTKWPAWSPWLVLEPEARLTFDADGRAYSWDGSLIGSGKLVKQRETENEEMVCSLEILKPWKSRSTVQFTFAEVADGTQVTWVMDGKLPLLMFWMKGMMETLVGMDYERGLTMLKDICELGRIPAGFVESGEEDFPGCSYVGITTECLIPELGPGMEEDFKRLKPVALNADVDQTLYPFCKYEKWNMNNGQVRYTIGFPVKRLPDSLPEGFVSGEIPANKVYVIKHNGAYRHLGNAWSLGMMLSRNKKFRAKKGQVPFEVYLNNPEETDEADLEVKICFPMLGA